MDFDNETKRLKTFANFPRSHVAPAALAAAGFIYTGESDRVRCVYGYCEIERWKDGDDPMTEHGAKFPSCRFVKERGTRRESESRGQGEVVADAGANRPQRPSTAGVVPSERPPLKSGGWGPQTGFRWPGEVVAGTCANRPQRPSTAGVVPSERPPLESGGWGPQSEQSRMSVASRGPEESRSTVENESEAMMATDVMRMMMEKGFEKERLWRAYTDLRLDGGLMPKGEALALRYWEIERCEGPSQ